MFSLYYYHYYSRIIPLCYFVYVIPEKIIWQGQLINKNSQNARKEDTISQREDVINKSFLLAFSIPVHSLEQHYAG